MNRKLLVIVFLAGLLLVGLGCGVAFAQYSQFDYAGEQKLGAEELAEVTLTEQLQHQGDIIVDVWAQVEAAVQADASVAKDAICVDVAYNEDYVEVVVLQDCRWATEENDAFGLAWGGGDAGDLQMIFDLRDAVLADIKEHQISAYSFADIETVTVRVHPDNVERVKFY